MKIKQRILRQCNTVTGARFNRINKNAEKSQKRKARRGLNKIGYGG
jgi:hypothetical protein